MDVSDKGLGVAEVGGLYFTDFYKGTENAATKANLLTQCRKAPAEIFFATTAKTAQAKAQTEGEKFLADNGFKPIGRRMNAYHGPNLITLWVRKMKRLSTKKFTENVSGHGYAAHCCGLRVRPIAEGGALPTDAFLTVMIAPKTPSKTLTATLTKGGYVQIAKGRLATVWANPDPKVSD